MHSSPLPILMPILQAPLGVSQRERQKTRLSMVGQIASVHRDLPSRQLVGKGTGVLSAETTKTPLCEVSELVALLVHHAQAMQRCIDQGNERPTGGCPNSKICCTTLGMAAFHAPSHGLEVTEGESKGGGLIGLDTLAYPPLIGRIVPKAVSISSTGISQTGRGFGTVDRSCGTPYRDSGAVSPNRAFPRRNREGTPRKS